MRNRWQVAARAMTGAALMLWAGLLLGQEPAAPAGSMMVVVTRLTAAG